MTQKAKAKELVKALLGGLGKFISGPGLALAASVLFKLFNDLRKFAADAFRTFSGLNASFAQQQQLQQGIVNILKENPKVLAQIQRGEISVDTAAKQILGSYKGLNAELIQMNNLATQLAGKNESSWSFRKNGSWRPNNRRRWKTESFWICS